MLFSFSFLIFHFIFIDLIVALPSRERDVQHPRADFLTKTIDSSQFLPKYVENNVVPDYRRSSRALGNKDEPYFQHVKPNQSLIPLYTTKYQPERSLLWHLSYGDSVDSGNAYGNIKKSFERQIPKFIQLYRFRNQDLVLNPYSMSGY